MQLKLETRAVMQITHVEMCDIIAVQYIWNRKSCLRDPSYSVEYKTWHECPYIFSEIKGPFSSQKFLGQKSLEPFDY